MDRNRIVPAHKELAVGSFILNVLIGCIFVVILYLFTGAPKRRVRSQRAASKSEVMEYYCEMQSALIVLIPRYFLQPLHQGFYCDDDTIRRPYHESTVPSYALIISLLTIPPLTPHSCRIGNLNFSRLRQGEEYFGP
ncbi:unnamed protein product [Toxocara canis]|uniref:G protein-coupled receptor n=1 Tax=Toxocara canis TaxID=6265 RepID=A0A183V8X4_TOXCA|nr:unnamed protein product [Toxocara canis]